MRSILIISAFVVSASANCLDCICQQESNCRNAACRPDPVTLSCGYLQIKRDYFLDCGEIGKRSGESTDTAWKRCAADKTCSYQCAERYFNRYKKKCPGVGQCEAMARLHNGGPSGCRKPATMDYFNSLKKKTGCDENSP